MGVRRLESYLLDLLLTASPWLALLVQDKVGRLDPTFGYVALDQQGDIPDGMGRGAVALALVAATATLSTLGVLLLDVVLFVWRGRTLGMACLGLAAERGSRWGAMALDALVIVAPSLGALVLAGPLNGNKALLLATPCAVALNVAFIAIGAPRTLVDRLSGVHILQDPSQEAAGGSGASMVDGLLLLAIGLPVALVFDWRDYGAAAVGSGTVTALVLALDIMVWATTGASIGSRAVRSRGAVLSS